MNTLGKKITKTFFKDEDGYSKLVALWSKKMQDSMERNKLKSIHHLLYQVVRGKDWRKGFSPTTNQKKLENGLNYYFGMLALHNALEELKFINISEGYVKKILEPFDGIIDENTLKLVKEYFPKFNENILIEEAYSNSPDREKVFGAPFWD